MNNPPGTPARRIIAVANGLTTSSPTSNPTGTTPPSVNCTTSFPFPSASGSHNDTTPSAPKLPTASHPEALPPFAHPINRTKGPLTNPHTGPATNAHAIKDPITGAGTNAYVATFGSISQLTQQASSEHPNAGSAIRKLKLPSSTSSANSAPPSGTL